MVDLQKKYNWVLDTLSYNSIETLIKALKPAIIDPAIQKHNELRLIKAREPKIRSANDFIDDKGLDNQSNSVDDGACDSSINSGGVAAPQAGQA